MIDRAEELVQRAERNAARAKTYLERDVTETELQACLELQDEVAEIAAPTIERRRQEVVAAGWAAIRAAAGEPGYDWLASRRRWMEPAVKSFIIRKWGRRVYEALPW
jgi:hypothetical protein